MINIVNKFLLHYIDVKNKQKYLLIALLNDKLFLTVMMKFVTNNAELFFSNKKNPHKALLRKIYLWSRSTHTKLIYEITSYLSASSDSHTDIHVHASQLTACGSQVASPI